MNPIPYHGERHKLGGLEVTQPAYTVRRIDGIEAAPELRGDDVVVPSMPGRRPLPREAESRLLAYALAVTNLDQNGALAADPVDRDARYLINLRALQAVCGQHDELTLIERTLANGQQLTARGWALGFGEIADPDRDETLGIARFQLADPYWYGPDITDAERAVGASPTDWQLEHPGTVRGHRIRFTFAGPISNPRVTNLATGFYVEALVTVGAGEELEIDCEAFTAALEGVNAIGAIRHSGGFAWMRIRPGANPMRVTATSPGGTLSTRFRPPYI